MRSPRRMSPDVVASLPGVSDPPPPDSLFWQMWNATTEQQQAALSSPFIQGIGSGTLSPETYGGFTISDALYCFDGAGDYQAAAQRVVGEPDLAAFLAAKATSYQSYNEVFPTTWRIKDGTNVLPYPATGQYADFESQIARGPDPIYTLIVMIPCELLWSWIATQVAPSSPAGNLYEPWITGNDDPSGAYKMGNYLASFMAAYPGVVDPVMATNLFAQAMTFEAQNFNSAVMPPP